MRESTRTGLHFGLTSGVITTLGLMVGLHAGTHSISAVVGGIVTIAIADSLSDALGIHIAKESESTATASEVWLATFATLLTKMLVTATFLVPVVLFSLNTAIIVGIFWGLGILVVLSVKLARIQGVKPWSVVMEHVAIAGFVIIVTHYVGDMVGRLFS